VALIWLWSTLKQIPVSRKLGIGLALIFLLFAFFNAWRTQYLKTHPGLRLEIVQLGTANGQTPNDSRILIWAALANRGEPTTADSWELFINVPNQLPLKAETLYLDPTRPIGYGMSNGQERRLSGDDILYNKAMRQPIQKGMKEVGFLGFEANIQRAVIEKKGTIFCSNARMLMATQLKQNGITLACQGNRCSYPA